MQRANAQLACLESQLLVLVDGHLVIKEMVINLVRSTVEVSVLSAVQCTGMSELNLGERRCAGSRAAAW